MSAEDLTGPRLPGLPQSAPASPPTHRPPPRAVPAPNGRGKLNPPGDSSQGTIPPSEVDPRLLATLPAWSGIATRLVLAAIPDGYEDRRHWGMTTEIFDGFDVELRDDRLLPRISKEKKTVRHGFWRKYRLDLVKPEKTFRVEISKLRPVEPGVTDVHVSVFARVKVTGKFENWVRGVKGLNMEVVSYASVVLRLQCRLAIRGDYSAGHVLPDLVFDPEVRGLRIYLTDLDTHKIGVIGGDLAEGLGDASRESIQNLLRKKERDLLTKARREVAEHKDELRLSASSLWGK